MPMQLWVAQAARETGFPVQEVDGWRERGSSSFNPGGLVWHHTAGASTGDMPSLRTLINGRSDLPGPLCNWGIGRSGTIYVIAAGRANHAGKGGWQGLAGNSSVLGIEPENNGSQPWPKVQADSYFALSSIAMNYIRRDAKYVCGHKEWAPSRKPDPHTFNMPAVREHIALQMKGGIPKNGEDDLNEDEKKRLWNLFHDINQKIDNFMSAAFRDFAGKDDIKRLEERLTQLEVKGVDPEAVIDALHDRTRKNP